MPLDSIDAGTFHSESAVSGSVKSSATATDPPPGPTLDALFEEKESKVNGGRKVVTFSMFEEGDAKGDSSCTKGVGNDAESDAVDATTPPLTLQQQPKDTANVRRATQAILFQTSTGRWGISYKYLKQTQPLNLLSLCKLVNASCV